MKKELWTGQAEYCDICETLIADEMIENISNKNMTKVCHPCCIEARFSMTIPYDNYPFKIARRKTFTIMEAIENQMQEDIKNFWKW
jgi:hypothetical protein